MKEIIVERKVKLRKSIFDSFEFLKGFEFYYSEEFGFNRYNLVDQYCKAKKGEITLDYRAANILEVTIHQLNDIINYGYICKSKEEMLKDFEEKINF